MALRRTLMNRLRRINLLRLDQVIALVLLVWIWLYVWHHTSPGAGRYWPMFGAVVFCVPVAFRRGWPLGGMLVILTTLGVKTVVSTNTSNGVLNGSGGLLPALLLVGYGVGAFAPPRRSKWVLALTVVVGSVNAVASGRTASVPFSAVFVVLLPYVFGRMMRSRTEKTHALRTEAERIDADRDAVARAAASGERARIARELHDVIAHSVSVMVIQAGGARMVMESDPERAMSSLRSVERAGRDALAEMRRLLGLLDSDCRPPNLKPQPGLADIRDLLSRAQAAGLDTALYLDGKPATVSPALDLCAYRVIQEALTNAIKHAAPAHADVHVRWQREVLEFEVADDGRGKATVDIVAGGHGLVGMRERVSFHGGVLQTGANPVGGFTVRALLPLGSASLP